MSTWNIQKALFAALDGNVSCPVYDHVPQDSTFPYIVVGEDLANEDDTDTEQGFDTLMTLHVWSRYRGKKETKQIQGEVYDLLHRQTLSITGQYTIELTRESSEVLIDADGLTYHGVDDYRLLSENT